MSQITSITELRRKKRREKREKSSQRTKEVLLRLRRNACGPGYDSTVNNMKNPKGYVDLYLDKDKKVAFTSNIAYVYIKFKGAKLIGKQIKEEEASKIINEKKELGEIVTSYQVSHNFYI